MTTISYAPVLDRFDAREDALHTEDRLQKLRSEAFGEAHRLMRPLLWIFFAIYLALNLVYEPKPVGAGVFLVLNGLMEALVRFRPSAALTRYFVGFMLMASAALLIDLVMGATWMHFAVFTNLAFLLAFRDWKVILVAEVTIAVHHLLFNYLQTWGLPVMVFRPEMLGLKMVVIHALFVVFECGVLFYICRSLVQNLDDRAAMEATLEQVMEVKGVAQNNLKIQSEIEAIVGANRDLRARSSRQADNVSDMREYMRAFGRQLHDTVGQSEQVTKLAGSAVDDAARGQAVVSDLVASIDVLAKSSRQIFSIVDVIDEIAAQTNLLAINAAVQAARAGESGRAFAVVAGEVRSLASRSAESSREIRGIIENNVKQVATGAKLAADSGNALREIVEGVERVKHLMEELRHANQRQSESLSDINGSIESVDTTTQQNMLMVEELQQSSEQLYAESTALAGRMDEALSRVST
ncbi:MAG TPA: methyl-accepting chemotaxis protein [Pseudomonadales bacterium]|nr:methyl-accepting chemotaxis protein [Pseudomonadales bacterium]